MHYLCVLANLVSAHCFRSDNCSIITNSSQSCVRVNLGCSWPAVMFDVDLSSATFHQIKSPNYRCRETDDDCDYAVDKSIINYTVLPDGATCNRTSQCVVYYDWPLAPKDQRCFGRQYLKINYTCHADEPEREHPTNSEETSTAFMHSQATSVTKTTTPTHGTTSMVTTGGNHNSVATNPSTARESKFTIFWSYN